MLVPCLRRLFAKSKTGLTITMVKPVFFITLLRDA